MDLSEILKKAMGTWSAEDEQASRARQAAQAQAALAAKPVAAPVSPVQTGRDAVFAQQSQLGALIEEMQRQNGMRSAR